MQKTLVFLEQHVQWLALGLAGVFFLFCVWAYVITPPATATIAGKPVAPGQIDELVRDGPVRDIDQSINNNGDLAIVVPDIVNPWQKQMDVNSAKLLADIAFPPRYLRGISEMNNGGPTGPTPADIVASLPTLPKAIPLAPSAGNSVVSMPINQKNAPGAQPVANTNFDQEWATAAFTIPAADLKSALLAVLENKGHGLTFTTNILHIELQRQRGTMGPNGPTFPNGAEGIDVVAVPRMLQAESRPLPDPKGTIPEKASFADWAEKNVELVYQPRFFDVHGGTPWAVPTAAPAAAPAAGAAKGVAGIPPVMPARANPAVQPNPALAGAAGAAAHNPGEIVPAAISQDILIWAHDDTVQPGQTYRYRIVYYMKNPVLGLTGVAVANLVDVLAVQSPPSDWSQPVTLPQTTKFWFASLRGNTATADVYKWKSGAWTKETPQTFSPGDRVADSDWTVIDVRNQPNSRDRDKYVLLTNDAGEVTRRSPNADRSNDDRKALENEVNGAAAPKDAAPAPARGAPARPAPGNRAAAPMPRGG